MPGFDWIVVPRGAEERAVRRALRLSRATAAVVTIGIGAHAATRGVAAALAATPSPPRRVLVTGLCGLLEPSLAVGEAFVYGAILRESGPRLVLDAALAGELAAAVPRARAHAVATDSAVIVRHAAAKLAFGLERGAAVVDMESLAVADALHAAGAAVAVLRVGSDRATRDLPDLGRALDGTGGIDGFALALAMLRHPRAGARLAREGPRSLAALRRAVYRATISATGSA